MRAREGAPIALEPITRAQAPVLRNLFELYAHDFSEYVRVDLADSGRFDLPSLPDAWWTRDDHFPFFLRWDGRLAGFALARRGSRVTGDRDVMDVAEFFVTRGARRRNVGTRTAHALFAAFPGQWEIRVRAANLPATRFWSRVVEAWAGAPVTGRRYSADDVDWEVFRVGARA